MAVSGILAVVCVLLAFRLWSQERNLRSGARQLVERLKSDSTAKVDMALPNKAAEELLAAVNTLKETHRRENMESREREQALRRQIANVSHDLRTPLTSISGYLQLLEEGNLTEEERREYFQVARSRAETLNILIGTFYDLSRIESGDYPITVVPLQLDTLLRRLLAESWTDFEEAGVVVDANLAEQCPPVRADENAALRVISNLLANAGRHACGSLNVRLFPEAGEVVTLFSNPAPDMEQEDVRHVFERSYTADKMRSGRNTGLGLAIVKALAERMGCTVEASLDRGIFTVRVRWKMAE